jgi:hypothetical protein
MHQETWIEASPVDQAQVAHAASKKIGLKLRKFYLRIRARKGPNVAIEALARKILCILNH